MCDGRPDTALEWDSYTVSIPSGTTGELDLVHGYKLPPPVPRRPWFLGKVYSVGATSITVRPVPIENGPTLGGTHPSAHSGIGAVTPQDWDGKAYLTRPGDAGATALTFTRPRRPLTDHELAGLYLNVDPATHAPGGPCS